MTTLYVIGWYLHEPANVNANPGCAGCEAIEADRTADARVLLALAARCTCGGCTLATVAELAAHAIEDAAGQR